MTIKEIRERCGKLSVHEEREVSDDYAELVFYNKDLNEWNKALIDTLGPAIKPAGVEPTKENLRLTENYGGIYDNQTLFKKDFGNVSVLAMFWPWQDNTHTTLKVALLKWKS